MNPRNVPLGIKEIQERLAREYAKKQELLKMVEQLSSMGLRVHPEEAYKTLKGLVGVN